MVTCKSTVQEVTFEWSHHRISLKDSIVRTTPHVFIIGRVKLLTQPEVSFFVFSSTLLVLYIIRHRMNFKNDVTVKMIPLS